MTTPLEEPVPDEQRAVARLELEGHGVVAGFDDAERGRVPDVHDLRRSRWRP